MLIGAIIATLSTTLQRTTSSSIPSTLPRLQRRLVWATSCGGWLEAGGLAVEDVADVGSPLAVEAVVAREGLEDAHALDGDGAVGDAEGMRVAILQVEPFATALVNEGDGGLRRGLDEQTRGRGRDVALVELVLAVEDEAGGAVALHGIVLLAALRVGHMAQHPCPGEVEAVADGLLAVGAGDEREEQEEEGVGVFYTSRTPFLQ